MLNNRRAQPPVLEQAVLNAGLSFEVIGFSQLIHAAAEYSSVTISCYDKNEQGLWRLGKPPGSNPGYAGRNSVSSSKKEGDGCTPAGLYRLGYAFGIKEKPETRMPYRIITPNSYWVDDPSSRHYNTWVEGTDSADWTSAERLAAYQDSYAYAVVIEYNTAGRIPGTGSAVFLHCGAKPTSGCIAVQEPVILKILKWLDPDKTPGILITSI